MESGREFEPNAARSEGYILVVEDMPTTATLIIGWLRRAGYNTRLATTYEEAKVMADESPPRLMIVNDKIKNSNLSLEEFIPYIGLPHYRWWGYPDIPKMRIYTPEKQEENVERIRGFPDCPRFMIDLARPINQRELIVFCDRLTAPLPEIIPEPDPQQETPESLRRTASLVRKRKRQARKKKKR